MSKRNIDIYLAKKLAAVAQMPDLESLLLSEQEKKCLYSQSLYYKCVSIRWLEIISGKNTLIYNARYKDKVLSDWYYAVIDSHASVYSAYWQLIQESDYIIKKELTAAKIDFSYIKPQDLFDFICFKPIADNIAIANICTKELDEMPFYLMYKQSKNYKNFFDVKYDYIYTPNNTLKQICEQKKDNLKAHEQYREIERQNFLINRKLKPHKDTYDNDAKASYVEKMVLAICLKYVKKKGYQVVKNRWQAMIDSLRYHNDSNTEAFKDSGKRIKRGCKRLDNPAYLEKWKKFCDSLVQYKTS